MTFERAHFFIENFQRIMTQPNNRLYFGQALVEVNGKSLEALEKQIPKRPLICCPLDEAYIMLDDNEYYRCPSCGRELTTRLKYNFCCDCGQAINWGAQHETH